MLRFTNYNVVFREIPDEVTLAVNISGCPNRCKGCHSPYLREDIGELLDEASLDSLLSRYVSSVTCVCFMGGDADPEGVERLSLHVRKMFPGIRTGWYSGMVSLPDTVDPASFDYIKTGPYVEELGPLDSPDTNQRMYSVSGDGEMTDITFRFRRKGMK